MDGILILAIETATGCGSVCLARYRENGLHLLAEWTSQPDMTHSRRLLGSVEWLMHSAGVQWDDLDGVAVSTGPGSFTGLRIGMAAAKSIVMAAGSRLVGVPTLDALACCTGESDRLVCALLDARKKQVYAGLYRAGEDGLPRRVAGPMVVTPGRLLEQINEPVLLVGPGAKVYEDIFQSAPQVAILPTYLTLPRAMHVALLAGGKFIRSDFLNPITAAPVYVRVPEAEENLRRQQLEQV